MFKLLTGFNRFNLDYANWNHYYRYTNLCKSGASVPKGNFSPKYNIATSS